MHGITRTAGRLHAREIGEYWNFDVAAGVARQKIDDFLYREYQRAVWHGVTPKKLLTLYRKAGEAILLVPMVHSMTFVPHFDHLEYAAAKCVEICANPGPPSNPPPSKPS
ncbi:MAG: hypothetical protein ABI547_01710 [Betaproteobacteria bacterium]